MAEAIENGLDGLLADVYGFEEQANCILRIANDIVFAAMLGSNAREKVIEKFTIHKQVQQLISIYEALINNKKCA